MVFTASENPGNSLQISHVKTWHQGQGSLHTCPCGWNALDSTRSFKPQLPLQAGKCGRFGACWQSVCPPPQCSVLLPAGPATTSHQARQHPGSPSTHVLLAAGTEDSRGGGRSSPLVVCWCCTPGCPVPPPLPWAALPACSLHPSLLTQHLNWQHTRQKCGWCSA